MIMSTAALACSCGKKEQPRPQNEPTLALSVRMPRIIEQVEKRLPAEKKTDEFTKQITFLKGVGLGKVEAFVYAGKETGIQPVLFVYGARDKYESLLTSSPLKDYLIKDGDNYRINVDAIPEKQREGIDLADYEISYNGSAFVCAPMSLKSEWNNPVEKPQNSTALATAEGALAGNSLGAFAVFIPEQLSENIKKDITDVKGLNKVPGSKMYVGLLGTMVDMLIEPFKDIKSLGASFEYDQDVRKLNYVQLFRDESKAEQAYSLMKEESADVDSDLVSNLIEQLQNDSLTKDFLQNDSKLNVKLSWKAKDDQVVGKSIMKATVGFVFRNAFSGGMKPTEGPIESKYTEEPIITEGLDIEKWKTMLASAISSSAFPDHFWDNTKDPKMTVQVDYLQLPNTSVSKVEYEVLSVLDISGKEIQRKVERKFPNTLNFSWTHGTRIELPVLAGTKKETLGKAKLLFKVSAPETVRVVEFKSSEKQNTWKSSGAVKVKVKKMDRDVVSVSFRGGKKAKVIAYDKTGKALAHSGSTWSDSSWSGKFKGVVSSIKVAVSTRLVEYEDEVWFDLNKGEALKLPETPNSDVRTRYDYSSSRIYDDIQMSELSELEVEWKEAVDNHRNDSLIIKMPKKNVKGNSRWQVNFFGKDKPIMLKGDAFSSNGDYVFSMKKGELAKVNRAFGKVKLSLYSGIKVLEVNKENDGKEQTVEVKPGATLTVTFNKNHVYYKFHNSGNIRELNFAAFDVTGKRLKSTYTRNGKAFWGIPVKFVVTAALDKIEKTVDFDLTERPIDETRFSKYQEDLEKQKEIYMTLKTLQEKSRRYLGYYGDSLAALHYLKKSKSDKKPMSLVPQYIAHSDPLGQQRFGYKLTPYKGYYFSLTLGKVANGENKQHARGDEREFFWKHGSFKSKRFRDKPLIIATPVDKEKPSFIVVWSDVMLKDLNGEKLEYEPENYYKDWIKLNY